METSQRTLMKQTMPKFMVTVLKLNVHIKFRSSQQCRGCSLRPDQSPLRILLIYMFFSVDEGKRKPSWNPLFPYFALNLSSFHSPSPQKAQEAGI